MYAPGTCFADQSVRPSTAQSVRADHPRPPRTTLVTPATTAHALLSVSSSANLNPRPLSAVASRFAEATRSAEQLTASLQPAFAAAQAAEAAARAQPTKIASLREPCVRPLLSSYRRPDSARRGTLREQLENATRGAEDVLKIYRPASATTCGLTASAPTRDACVVISAIELRVGRLLSREGTPICFDNDAARYVFRASGVEVAMTMRFADIAASARVQNATLIFKVGHMPAFRNDYNAANAQHVVAITFPSAAVAAKALALVRRT